MFHYFPLLVGPLLFAAAGTGLLDGITSKPLEMLKLRQQILPSSPLDLPPLSVVQAIYAKPPGLGLGNNSKITKTINNGIVSVCLTHPIDICLLTQPNNILRLLTNDWLIGADSTHPINSILEATINTAY